MTIEMFNALSFQEKAELIFDAKKITEKAGNEDNYQLFQINNFFIETRTSREGKFKRSFKSFTLKELPADYISEVLLLPIVTLAKDIKAKNQVFKRTNPIYTRVR